MQTLLEEWLPQASSMQRAQLARFYELLLISNARMNLTTIVEPLDVLQKHFIDSLLASPYIEENARCIDVGTGAGFPGIPLCIMRPDITLTLLDSLKKRIAFLEEAAAALGLAAVCCVHGRAEDVAKAPRHRAQYDVALSRAVAPLPVLLELTVPFVRVHGAAIAYKGKAALQEAQAAARAAATLGCTLEVLPLAASYAERALVRAHKVKPTPPAYPRKAGDPGRRPL